MSNIPEKRTMTKIAGASTATVALAFSSLSGGAIDGAAAYSGHLQYDESGRTMDVRRFINSYEFETQSALQEHLSRVENFANLNRGWNSYSAPPPNEMARETAKALLMSLSYNNLVPQHVNPSVVGGIGVTFIGGDKEVFIEITNENKVFLVLTDFALEDSDPIVKSLHEGESLGSQLSWEIQAFLS